jgi:cytochrome c-type biogenesis protein
MDVTVGLAFLAGLASFLSPCVFSLVPAYVGYLSGRTLATPEGTSVHSRTETFSHGLAFVLGFSVVFITLGLAVSALGQVLYDFRPILSKVGGAVVILFGLHMTGILRIPFLEYDLRPQNRVDQQRSYLSSALMGVFFSAGWSPCVGPVLGAILTIALNQGSLSRGFELLVSYSAGMAIPFLIAAVGIGWISQFVRRYRKAMHYVEVGMGVVVIAVGVMLFLGVFSQLARFGYFVDFGI